MVFILSGQPRSAVLYDIVIAKRSEALKMATI